MKLILASVSKGRKYLLSQLKIPFAVLETNLDEDCIVAKNPLETIRLRAKMKAEEALKKITQSANKPINKLSNLTDTYSLLPNASFILSADTEVIFDNKLIGKPKKYDDAVRMLKILSGKTHEVVTAVYIFKIPKSPRSLNYSFISRSFVTFRKLSEKDIKRYLSLTEYKRFTGGYAVIASPQDFITKIEGSISNVIGLPLEKVIPILEMNKFV